MSFNCSKFLGPFPNGYRREPWINSSIVFKFHFFVFKRKTFDLSDIEKAQNHASFIAFVIQ